MVFSRGFVNRSKYGNVKQTYNGYSYDSKLEALQAAALDTMLKENQILDWEKQFKISFDINGKHICNYYVDFAVTQLDGSLEFLEVKGFETDVWRLKWKLLEATHDEMYPGSTLRIVR